MSAAFAPLMSVRNLSVDDIRIEMFNVETNLWSEIVPLVQATSNFKPAGGFIWIPKGSIVRSVSTKTNEQKTIFGIIDEHPDILQG